MNKSVNTLQELVKLDYDAIEAYDEAIKRLDDAATGTKLAEFRDDHMRHTENIGNILRNLGKVDGLDAAMEQTLAQNLADEKRHKRWIESRIEAL